MTDYALNLDHQLCHRFYTVANAFTRAYRPLLAKLDLTYPQYITMLALWEQDGLTIQQLLQRTKIDGGAMSLMLKKLANKELIEIQPDEQDKRVKHIVLTKNGVKAKETAQSIPHQMRCNLHDISDQEALQLMQLIDKLSNSLNRSLCSTELS